MKLLIVILFLGMPFTALGQIPQNNIINPPRRSFSDFFSKPKPSFVFLESGVYILPDGNNYIRVMPDGVTIYLLTEAARKDFISGAMDDNKYDFSKLIKLSYDQVEQIFKINQKNNNVKPLSSPPGYNEKNNIKPLIKPGDYSLPDNRNYIRVMPDGIAYIWTQKMIGDYHSSITDLSEPPKGRPLPKLTSEQVSQLNIINSSPVNKKDNQSASIKPGLYLLSFDNTVVQVMSDETFTYVWSKDRKSNLFFNKNIPQYFKLSPVIREEILKGRPVSADEQERIINNSAFPINLPAVSNPPVVSPPKKTTIQKEFLIIDSNGGLTMRHDLSAPLGWKFVPSKRTFLDPKGDKINAYEYQLIPVIPSQEKVENPVKQETPEIKRLRILRDNIQANIIVLREKITDTLLKQSKASSQDSAFYDVIIENYNHALLIAEGHLVEIDNKLQSN